MEKNALNVMNESIKRDALIERLDHALHCPDDADFFKLLTDCRAALSDNTEKNRFLHQINKLCEKHPHYQKVWKEAADNGNFSMESNVLSFVEELMDDAIPPGCILVKDEPALWWDGGNEVCGHALRDWDARTGGTLSINYKIPLYIAADGYKQNE